MKKVKKGAYQSTKKVFKIKAFSSLIKSWPDSPLNNKSLKISLKTVSKIVNKFSKNRGDLLLKKFMSKKIRSCRENLLTRLFSVICLVEVLSDH